MIKNIEIDYQVIEIKINPEIKCDCVLFWWNIDDI